MPGDASHPDRSARLRVGGALAVAAGLGSTALGLAHLALPLAKGLVPDLAVDLGTVLTGLITYVAVGVTLIACGVGSMRLRRWTRPAMLTVGWVWLLAGVTVLGYALVNLDDLVLLAGSEMEQVAPAVERALRVAIVLPVALFGCLPPLLLLGIYRDPAVLATCRARHPAPDWSDRCPSHVLILALALGYTGLLTLPLALHPTAPWFGRLWTGLPGSIVLLLTGAVCLWAAWKMFRLRAAGWWATLVLTGLLAVSTVWTLLAVPGVEWYRAMGYPEARLREIEAQASASAPWLAVSAVVALGLATWLYLWAVRAHFFRSSTSR